MLSIHIDEPDTITAARATTASDLGDLEPVRNLGLGLAWAIGLSALIVGAVVMLAEGM